MKRQLAVLLAAGLLVSCQQPAPRTTPTAPATSVRPGGTEYLIDASASEIRLLVYRAGALARLGHNHVTVSHELAGSVYRADPLGESGFELTVPVNGFAVDAAGARREEGADFATEPTAADIQGTRNNMLGDRVLAAAEFPQVIVRGAGLSGTLPDVTLNCSVMLRGTSVELLIPAQLMLTDSAVTVSGQVSISHAELGLTPFSVMLGALSVAPDITVKFRIHADRTNQ